MVSEVRVTFNDGFYRRTYPQDGLGSVELTHSSGKKFRTHVDLIFKGPLEEKSEEIKVTYLLLWPYGLATKVARSTPSGQV